MNKEEPTFTAVITEAVKNPESLKEWDFDPEEQEAAEELRQALYLFRSAWRSLMDQKVGLAIIVLIVVLVIYATIQLF